MLFRFLMDTVKTRLVRSMARPKKSVSFHCRPRLESLEGRCLLSNYAITDLRSFAGLPCEARDLNNLGQVVGWTYDLNANQTRAVLWDGNTAIDLGTLGGPGSGARGINELGQIVGWSKTADNATHAFLLTPEDTDGNGTPDRWYRDTNIDGANDLMLDLDAPASGFSVAYDINNFGQVVGLIEVSSSQHGFLWQNGAMTDLYLLGAPGIATAINDAGQIITGGGLWQNGVFTPFEGAVDINDSGQIVGASSFSGGRGYLWTPNTPNGTVGTIDYLEPLFGDVFSFALGVNAAGQVVGKSHFPSGSEEGSGGEYMRATLWGGGEPQSLSALAVPSDLFIGARAINDGGQILAEKFVGSMHFSDCPVLLTPIAAPPSITMGDMTVAEGNTSSRATTFTVTLSSASGQPVTVNYDSVNGNATAGNDYQAASGTLTFAPGETSKTITVLVHGDRLGEPNETFFVNLSSPTNATIADGQGQGTILDDEPRISISDVTRVEGRKGQKTLFVFTVTLSAAYDQAVTMWFKTVNGTARTSDRDYIAKTGTLTFAPGETTKTITIEVKGDSKKEANETFYLDLFGNSGNALFTKNRGLGTILNDD